MSGMDETGNNQRFARVACVIGGVFDALMLPPMLIPRLGGKLFGLQAFAPGPDYRYAIHVAAALMLGWTLLLFWAARRPIERAAVLPLTAIVVGDSWRRVFMLSILAFLRCKKCSRFSFFSAASSRSS